MSKKKSVGLVLLGIGMLVLAACGPSAEEMATMTAAAWTPTPRPTNTPTPIPYDLSLNVVDSDGNPLEGAQVTFVELDETQAVDATGQLTWADLDGDAASFTVLAQGYLPAEASFTLERGANDFEISLERDAYGLLLGDACGAGESLLYIEDFQDNAAAGWMQIDFHGGGWTIADRADEPGNLVASNSTPETHPSDMLGEYVFDQAVWRLWYLASGQAAVSFNWRQSFNYDTAEGHIDEGRYQILVDSQGGAAIRHLELPPLNIVGDGGPASLEFGQWHFLEMSTFEGLTQLWVDGVVVAAYGDPRPIPPGGVGLEIIDAATAPDTVTSFDNIVVCELTAPFASIFIAPATEE